MAYLSGIKRHREPREMTEEISRDAREVAADLAAGGTPHHNFGGAAFEWTPAEQRHIVRGAAGRFGSMAWVVENVKFTGQMAKNMDAYRRMLKATHERLAQGHEGREGREECEGREEGDLWETLHCMADIIR